MEASCAIQGKKESQKKKCQHLRGLAGEGGGGGGGMCAPGIDSNWGQA